MRWVLGGFLLAAVAAEVAHEPVPVVVDMAQEVCAQCLYTCGNYKPVHLTPSRGRRGAHMKAMRATVPISDCTEKGAVAAAPAVLGPPPAPAGAAGAATAVSGMLRKGKEKGVNKFN